MNALGLPTRAPASWIDQLAEFLAIPSVSADPARATDVLRAGQWVADFIESIGGDARLVSGDDGSLVIGEVLPSRHTRAARRVGIYGHYDVQPTGSAAAWTSPPFQPAVRDGWVYARGATDNKGNLFCLLKGVELLARSGRLPVHLQILCEGQEEIGGPKLVQHVAANPPAIDALVSFDSNRLKADQPTLYVGMRGLVYLTLKVRTGSLDLHSGDYGGAAPNALNALMQALTAIVPLPEALRLGAIGLTDAEERALASVRPDLASRSGVGSAPLANIETLDFWRRTLAEPAIDLHAILGGSPELQKTIVLPHAEARLSIRTAPGQDAAEIGRIAQSLLEASLPEGAQPETCLVEATSGYLQDPGQPALAAARHAIERATGQPPLTVRNGTTIPVHHAIARHDIPIVFTGFGLPESNVHAADERFRLDLLSVGARTAAEILTALASAD